MGAAFLAGLAVGFWENMDEIRNIWATDVTFEPTTDRAVIEEGIKGWYKAVDALQYWTNQP